MTDPMVTSSCQSALRAQVRMANPVAINTRTTGASLAFPIRSPAAYTPRTMQAVRPIDGRYIKRSAIMVPMGKIRFAPGRMVNRAKQPRKKAVRWMRYRQTRPAAAAATAIQASQSAAVPLARGICE